MKKLKIALVFDDTLDKPDGVQQYVLTVGKWLAAEGHDVHYIVGETKRRDLPNVHSLARNMKVRFNGNRMSIPLPVSRRNIRALLAHEKFDVLHVQVPYSPQLAARVILAAPRTAAVVGTFHILPQSGLVRAGNRALGLYLHRSLKRFDRMMAVSVAAKGFAKDFYGLKCEVVPNTIDLKPFFAGKPFPKYKGKPTIVFLGRLVERKGCQYLLQAAVELRRTFSGDFRVVICGGGPLDESLKSYVCAQNLESIVEFTGYLAEADKPRYLASADIVAYPSTGGESFGIVILEAMAAARGPVLAGNNPGYASVLADHRDMLFEPKDTAAFAKLLQRYLEDATARAAARAWQQSFVHQFDVPIVGEKILAVYQAVLTTKDPSR